MSTKYFEDQLQAAITARDAHVNSMGDSYNPQAMETMAALQRRVSEARTELERAKVSAAAAATNVTVTTSVSTGGGNTAIVSLMAGGKGDKRVEVPVGTKLSQILQELNWDSTNHAFKRRVGPGQTAELQDGLGYVFQAGEYEILMVPQVRGGC